jgi:predicted dehydrogenase
VERFNPAVLELGRRIAKGWVGTLYSITSRRAGPFPARIRDVGVTIDLATHDADILSWVAGERPTRVYAETAQRLHATNEDLLFGLLHFPSGATGMLDVNWLTPAKRRQLTVVGEEGMFELDYLTQRLTFTSADVGSPTIIDGYATTFEGNVVVIEVASREPLAAELDAFLAVARGGGRPVVNGEDGLWALAIAAGLLRAAAEARPVDLAGFADHIPAR